MIKPRLGNSVDLDPDYRDWRDFLRHACIPVASHQTVPGSHKHYLYRRGNAYYVVRSGSYVEVRLGLEDAAELWRLLTGKGL